MNYKIKKPLKNSIGQHDIGDIIDLEGDYGFMIQLLLDLGYIEEYDENKKWEPKYGDKFYYVRSRGSVDYDFYGHQDWHEPLAKFIGVFKTKQEAEQARDKIKAFISNGFK